MDGAVKSDKLRALFHRGRQRTYNKSEIILRADDTPQGVYLIESGMIKIYSLTRQGHEHVQHFFGPGDVFPVIWAFQGLMPNMYYEALGPTKLWVVDRDKFMEVASADREVLLELLEEVVSRYRRYAGRVDNLLYSDARERCVYRLLSLANRFGLKTDAGLIINANITHEDLARSINMTRETFGRSLSRLQKRGLIGYDSEHRIIIKDLPTLIQVIGRNEIETVWPELLRFDALDV